jgi:predicted transcriptional regulator
MSTEREHAAAREIEKLRAENDRLSALADKWNSECDEMREDNKRLDAECAKLRKLLEDCQYALEYSADMTKPEGLSGCDCPICTTTIALHKELGEKS